MLLQITTTHQPATDLGYLLHKHPDRFQSVKLSHGKAHLFYPEANEKKASICLLLDIDPIEMVKGARHLSGKGFALGQYVNDRPYTTSSFMSVALAKSFATAMNGTCSNKPELVEKVLPFEVKISVVSAPKGGEVLIRKLFEPLGYEVEIERHILDPKFPEWGESKYYTLLLKNTLTTQKLLNHLYVLLPVLDNDKHYYVSEHEVEKLLKKGEGWLYQHPEKEQIIYRYLFNLGSLTKKALAQLNLQNKVKLEEKPNEEETKKITLHEQRLQVVSQKLKELGVENILDLGCGEGKLIRLLLRDKQFKKIVGMDISHQSLKKAKERLHYNDMAPKQKERLDFFQGALTYKDSRLEGYDAAALVEVIEHLDLDRLSALERVVFEFAQPKNIIITTPNKEYNVLFETMETHQMRHDDHRFEWTRQEFQNWANTVAKKHEYSVKFEPIGEEEKEVGAPSQMAVFSRGDE